VVDPVAQDTARTFDSGVYEAVVFQVGVVAEASGELPTARSTKRPRVIRVESAALTTPLTVGTATPPPPETTPNDSAIVSLNLYV
jgi:hypothetical protein